MTSVPLFESYQPFVPPLSLLSSSTSVDAEVVPSSIDALARLKGLDGFVLCFASLRSLRGFEALAPPVVAKLLERCELERERLSDLGARPIALLNAKWSNAPEYAPINEALTSGILRNVVELESNDRSTWVAWICDKLSRMANHTPFRLSPCLPGALDLHQKAGLMRVILKDLRLALGDLPSPQTAIRALESALMPFVGGKPVPVELPANPAAPVSQVVSVARPILSRSQISVEVDRVSALAMLELRLPALPEVKAPDVALAPLKPSRDVLNELALPSSLLNTPLRALTLPVQEAFEPNLLEPQGPAVPLRFLSAISALLGASFGLWVIVEGLRVDETMMIATGLALVISLFGLSAVLATKPRFY